MGRGAATTLAAVQRRHRQCVRCVDAGHLKRAHPVFSGHQSQRILLVGQAPGPIEDDVTRPFAGRAGRQLMRWMSTAGLVSEAEVRRRVFMTSMTTCFPGRLTSGGDRRPSAREVALCSGWLDAYLALLAPRLIICVGTLAQGRFLPGRRLDELIGTAWTAAGVPLETTTSPVPPTLLPLPHPSGQSRWLNEPARRLRLADALARLRDLVAWAEAE